MIQWWFSTIEFTTVMTNSIKVFYDYHFSYKLQTFLALLYFFLFKYWGGKNSHSSDHRRKHLLHFLKINIYTQTQAKLIFQCKVSPTSAWSLGLLSDCQSIVVSHWRCVWQSTVHHDSTRTRQCQPVVWTHFGGREREIVVQKICSRSVSSPAQNSCSVLKKKKKKLAKTNFDFPLSGNDVLGSSPLAAGGNPSLLLCLGLVLQLHRVMVILDIHQAAEGVQHLIEQCQDAQQGSKKVELDHRRHHHYSGTAGCKNKEKEKKKIRQLKPVMAFELGYYRDAFKVRVLFIY